MQNGGNAEKGSKGDSESGQEKLDGAMTKWTKVVGVFTGLLFATSLISNVFIYTQIRNAAKSEKITHQQLRAVLATTGVLQAAGIDAEGAQATGFVVQLQNIGGTRTAWLHGWNSIQYFDGGVPENFDPTRPRNKVDEVDTMVGAGGIYQFAPVGVLRREMQEAANHKGQIIMWGRVDYADIYKSKVVRIVNFCLLVDVSAAPANQFALNIVPYRNSCNNSK